MRAPAKTVEISDRDARLCRTIVPKLLDWFAREARDLPWRRTRDPYAIWVSEIMLQQTQVAAVIGYWNRWMESLPTIHALATARIETVLKLWEGLGYYRRARNLHQAAANLVATNQGRFPTDFESILELPGIGRYTAGAISSIAYNQACPIVDGNVIRVLSRVFALSGDPTEKVANAKLWRLAEILVGEAARQSEAREVACSHFNQSMMELGALICTPSVPSCDKCPLEKSCRAKKQDQVDAFPELKRQVRITTRRYATLVLQCRGQWLLRQRAEEGVNGGFWEFPAIELAEGQQAETVLGSWLNLDHANLTYLGEITHAITRYRNKQEIYGCVILQKPARLDGHGQWLTRDELGERPLTRAHRRIVTDFLSQTSRS